jgi:hypothetical protein
MEDAGIEPATSRMQSERSATELNPLDGCYAAPYSLWSQPILSGAQSRPFIVAWRPVLLRNGHSPAPTEDTYTPARSNSMISFGLSHFEDPYRSLTARIV